MRQNNNRYIAMRLFALVVTMLLVLSGMALAANIIQNPGAEEIGDNNKPVFWSEYTGGSTGQWGVYSKETDPGNVYAGNHSVFYRIGYNKDSYSNCALVVGVSNGFTGKKAYPVTPGETYYYSFWLKGTGYRRTIIVVPWGFTESDVRIQSNGRNVPEGFAGKYLKVTPSNEWTKYSGSFVVPDNVRTIIILFHSFGNLNKDFDEGAEFIVDDMYLSTEPER